MLSGIFTHISRFYVNYNQKLIRIKEIRCKRETKAPCFASTISIMQSVLINGQIQAEYFLNAADNGTQ